MKEIPGIIIPNFFPADACDQIVLKLRNEKIKNYANAPEVQVGKWGLSHMESWEEKTLPHYFQSAAQNKLDLDSLFNGVGPHPLYSLMQQLSKVTEKSVSVPCENENQIYSVGIFRNIISGIPPHFDSAALEYSDETLVAKAQAQLSWNLYLSETTKGAELVLHELDARDLFEHGIMKQGEWRIPTDYMEGVRTVSYRPKKGDVVIFNSEVVHSVQKPVGGERYTMSSFIGLAPDNQLWFWS